MCEKLVIFAERKGAQRGLSIEACVAIAVGTYFAQVPTLEHCGATAEERWRYCAHCGVLSRFHGFLVRLSLC